ncbi:MAG: efflux RND transporter permease subunit [Planctomycetota bacterium]
MSNPASQPTGPLSWLIRFCLEQKLVVFLVAVIAVGWGLMVAPFDWDLGGLPRDPVPVDAIPDLGENQQIVFTQWTGRSPQDIEDQVTYPLTVALQGIPGVDSIRSFSYFGFSSIYVIFEEDIDFYWSRSRILEKLASLPAGTLPPDVQPALGPDATALGQVYWYTLEGRGPDGQPVGGWDLDELRAVQDFQVRYALAGASGVAEVASVGGFVREYQIDLDPNAMRAAGVTLPQVYDAVRRSNLDVSAGTIEENHVEYMIRGLGFIQSVEDLRKAVVVERDNTPITVEQVAEVSLGPAPRRGVLDKDGAEAVGGVVTARYGVNPLEVILGVHDAVDELAPGLPRKVVVDWDSVDRDALLNFADGRGINAFADEAGFLLDHDAWLAWLDANPREDWPSWITTSQITVVPFYDRSGLIYETLDTLSQALTQQVLVTIIVVLVMVLHLRSSVLISLMLPGAILITFIAMKVFGVDANVVALAGIAIAIGTVVDVGIVLTENVLEHLERADPGEPRLDVVFRACREVGGAVTTAVLTTVVGFLPVFAMVGAEGKLFSPLAYTKTFALIASIGVALVILPPLTHLLIARRSRWAERLRNMVPDSVTRWGRVVVSFVAAVVVAWLLAGQWEPLGRGRSHIANFGFVVLVVGGLLLAFRLFQLAYAPILRWALAHKLFFLSMPTAVVILGLCVWLGFGSLFGWVPDPVKRTALWQDAHTAFPGLGSEFMPALDEGSFLYMPTTMPHASIGQSADVLRQLDAAIRDIPEVDMVVGKIGRAESPLDPAPISMIESVIHYIPEYRTTEDGQRVRQWRDHIQSTDDIWAEIQNAAQLPGFTSAPKLQPIETRQVMLQTGMRAPMGIKVRGPDLQIIQDFGFEIERVLRQVPGVNPATVNADRIVGTPYLEIDIDRDAIARYGINTADVQRVIEVAIGGRAVTTTVEGRERFAVRVRYLRELRDSIDAFGEVLVSSADGSQQVPLTDLAEVRYARGPRMIKSEDTFLVGYITFGPQPGMAEVNVIDNARTSLDRAIAEGELVVPRGVSYRFAGSFENQVRAAKTLMVVLPLSLAIIFMILYLQFRRVSTTLMIFSGIAVAWAGGFLLIWCYNQPWFLDVNLFGENLRDVFRVQPINLSVAVWVGFLALFGIATDDGVVIATYLKQRFDEAKPTSSEDIRQATLDAGLRRVRPCLMTTATTILALLPVLTATGRGSDIMLPMALPSVGGMLIALLTMFVVPVLYCLTQEIRAANFPTTPD